jgi:type IV pilus assembly protein PilC
MAEFVLKYADARGEIHNKVAEGASEEEIRERLSKDGFLIYSIRPRGQAAAGIARFTSRKKLDLEKFLIFNQQFVTLIRAGLPILKALDLLADRLTDAKLGPYIRNVRDEVKRGSLLSDAFEKQGLFPSIYITSVLAGERAGSLVEVLDRYISYQKTALAVRKKILLSLMYPSILVGLVIVLVIFLITFVVPKFAQLYESMGSELPGITRALIAVGTSASEFILPLILVVAGAFIAFRIWMRSETAKLQMDRLKLRTPILGEIWIKYQVAQFSRILSTLLIGGIPLVQALGTAAESLGTRLLRRALDKAVQGVREGQALSSALDSTKIFPSLSIDMMEVGESTGALPSMLNSVADFYEDDVQTRTAATLSLIEPGIMIFMGIFVAFVLIALYLPIFSIADSFGGGR